MKPIFLSYASEDAEPARQLGEALRAAGLDVWLDQTELRGGDAWDASIRARIRDCALFVPIISANTDRRSEGYFRLEWKLAVDRSHLIAEDRAFIVPIVIDATVEATARVPDGFRARQWTRLRPGETSQPFVDLVKALLTAGTVLRQERSGAAGASAYGDGSQPVATRRRDMNFRIAVLPFRYGGANADAAAFAEGLADQIATVLARFSYLNVIGGSATLRAAGEALDAGTVGRELGARYVMEGSLRQSGATLRVAVQLVDAESSAQLWSESFDRAFSPDTLFEVQDDIVSRIAVAVADNHGALPRSMSEEVRAIPVEELGPYEAVIRCLGYYERITPEEHAQARDGLERAVRLAPTRSEPWAMLGLVYADEHKFGYNVRPDSLGRALAAARRAIEYGPANAFAYYVLAVVLFFRKESAGAQVAAERALALNPYAASCVAAMGEVIAYSGDWERGCALLARARTLHPRHHGFYWFVPLLDAYRKRDYVAARDFALRVDMPGFFYSHAFLAAVYGQLGDHDAARRALGELLALRPDFVSIARAELDKWWQPELVESLLDGLRKAGLTGETR